MANPHPVNQAVLNERFFSAVRSGDIRAVDKALADGADINAPIQRNGGNALFRAVGNRNYAMVEALLQRGIEANTATSTHDTPLMRTVINRDVPMAELLLEYGSDPQYPPLKIGRHQADRIGPSLYPLHQACIYGLDEMAAVFIKHGADLDICSKAGGSPVWYAAANGKNAIVCQLVNAGADVEGRYENWQMRPSYHPRMGSPSTQKPEPYLSHRTSLFHPTSSNLHETVALLLDAGIDATAVDDKGKNAVEAVYTRDKPPAKALAVLERYAEYPTFKPEMLDDLRKADLFTPNDAGYCLLDSPSTWQHFEDITKHLQQQGERITAAELEAAGKDGKSWLQRGVECFATVPLFRYYSAEVGELPLKNLLTSDRKASPLLNALCERQQVHGLFTRDVWQNSSREDLRSVYQALPKDMQANIRNYHQLLASIPPAKQEMGR